MGKSANPTSPTNPNYQKGFKNNNFEPKNYNKKMNNNRMNIMQPRNKSGGK